MTGMSKRGRIKIKNNLFLVLRAASPMAALFSFHLFISYVVPLYWWLYWFDNVMHFAGGLVTAISVWIVVSHYTKKRKLRVSPRLAMIVFLVGSVAIVGILWEVYEFLLDVYFPHEYFLHQPGIADTMGDLVLDLLGASAVSFFLTRPRSLPGK